MVAAAANRTVLSAARTRSGSKPISRPRTITSCARSTAGSTKPSTTGSAQSALAAIPRPAGEHDRRAAAARGARSGESACRAGRSARARSARRPTTSITQAICAAPGRLRAVEPGGEDRERQRAHAEIFAGADVVERLHQGERRGRPRARGARAAARRGAPASGAWRRACARPRTGTRSASGTSRARRGTRKDRAPAKTRRSRRAASGCSGYQEAAVGFQPVSASSAFCTGPNASKMST